MNKILFAFIAFVDLQNRELKENLKYWKEKSQEDTQEVEKLSEQLDDDNVIIERFLIASGKSKDLTEPEEFEEVFEDIEQTYSEHEELKNENGELKAENFAFEGLVKTQDDLIEDLQSKNDSIQKIADDLQRRNHDLTQMLETKEKALEKAKELNHCMSGQMDFIKSELELKLSAEIKNKNCVIEELKRVDKQKDKWREEAEKLRNTLNEIEKQCSKYQTCIIVLKKDILDIINGTKDKNVLHKEKETK